MLYIADNAWLATPVCGCDITDGQRLVSRRKKNIGDQGTGRQEKGGELTELTHSTHRPIDKTNRLNNGYTIESTFAKNLPDFRFRQLLGRGTGDPKNQLWTSEKMILGKNGYDF